MLSFKRNYLQHALAVSRWLRERGASAGIDPATQVMDICLGEARLRFFPQFSTVGPDGLPAFTPELSDGVSGFVGWLPYVNKRWPVAQDKLAFKLLARSRLLRTPDWSGLEGPAISGPVLVKQQRSSFGRGMQGPFPDARGISLGAGDYVEAFITGRMVKAWFWNAMPLVVEAAVMPTVTGDGVTSFRALIAAQCPEVGPWLAGWQALAQLQGLGLDNSVPYGVRVLADYRYMSPLNPALRTDHNIWPAARRTALGAQVMAAGAACAKDIPAEVRGEGTLFTIDGIEDAEGRLWLLEANCNPQLHPACYPGMLDALFPERTS